MRWFLLFLKGILMGICDLIPGISGGTIAFITGIYTRLINAVKAISPKLVYDIVTVNKRELGQDIKRLDLGFLIILFLGIATALLLGSRVIKFLLDNYFVYTLSFFIGLILASSKIIYDNIKSHSKTNLLFGFIGFVAGILISFLVPVEVSPSLGYVFIGGFVAISAMFLPGISGAFILLIMGLYELMIDILQDILGHLSQFITFVAGALLGMFTISRIVSFLFKKDRCKTLYFLLGLVLGSLSIPLRKILMMASLDILNLVVMILLFAIGMILVIILSCFRK